MEFKDIDQKNDDSVCFVLETELDSDSIIKKEIIDTDFDCTYNLTDFGVNYDIEANHFMSVEMKPEDIELNPAKYLIQANDPRVGFVKLENDISNVNFINKDGLSLSDDVSQIQKDLTDCYQITIPDLSTFESNNIKDQFAKAIAFQNVILSSKNPKSPNQLPLQIPNPSPQLPQVPQSPLQSPSQPQTILPIQQNFPCNFCNEKFLTEKMLNDHKNSTHPANKPYTCDLCNKGFNHKKSLTRHKLYHTGEKSHFCEICSKGFIRKENLSRHLKTHVGEKIFCRICYKIFEDLNELGEHQKVHFEGKKYFCELCNKGFAHKRSLNRHKLYHTGEKNNVCEICQKGFIRKENLTRHKRSHEEQHTTEKPNIYEEKVLNPLRIEDINQVHSLDKTNAYDESQKDFLKLDLNTENKTHIFHISLKTYKNASTDTNQLNKNILNLDTNQFDINDSGQLLNTTDFTADPNQNQLQMVDHTYTCHVCQKNFVKKVDLNTHQQSHSDKKLYTCDTCGKSYNHKQNLVVHSYSHTDQKPFYCEICNKGFSQYQDLSRHKHVHTGITPYICDVCGKGFKQKYSMDIHKYTHTGHKPFVCQYCNKGFSQNDSLTRHKRVHTGETPYVCNVCNLAFRRSDTLVKHKRRTHVAQV